MLNYPVIRLNNYSTNYTVISHQEQALLILNLGGQICYEIVRKIGNLVVPRSKLNTLRKILKIAAPFNQN